MKLFNKTIDRQLFKQYPLGSDLSKQEVVVKIFNPYGRGTWFIINSDPEDPDYLWAIVDLGYGAEVGSVSRSDLENYRGRFGLGFERDLSFDPVNALELFRGVREGKFYVDGGGVGSSQENTFDKIFVHYGFTKRRGAYGVRPYEHKKLGTYAQIDDKTRSIIIETPDSEYKGGYSVKGVIEFLKSKGFEEKGSYADGGDIESFSDNQRMIMNQNVEVEHHHEELEDILEDKIEVPAWVVAKMETATQNLSDITHYLDGQKELMEEEQEDDDDVMSREVVEPIVVNGGSKAEITKNFTEDAWGNFRGFLKGMEGIDLRDDYTFDYKDEQYEIEPIINTDENGVSNAVFTIFDGDGEEVGEVMYSREGGKQKFTANSEFFSWNNAKFEDGGYFDGTIPSVSSYMSTYANGGEIEYEIEYKDSDGEEFTESFKSLKEANAEISKLQKAGYKITDRLKHKVVDGHGTFIGRFENGGGIGFIPMDLEEDLRITAKWGGTNIKGVIGILNAMIDSGLTDEDLKPKPTKSGFAYQNAIEKKTKEIWAKIEPNYKGDFKGNMYYSTIRHLVERANSSDDILKRFKPFRKNQKDSFANGGSLTEDDVKVGDYLQKKDNKAKAKVHDIKKDRFSTEIFVEDLWGNKVQRAITLKDWKKIAEPKRDIKEIADFAKQISGEQTSKSVKPKYILKADIKTVTLKRNGKEVTYKGADVYNGANMFSGGGDLSSKANYVPKRDVVEVELKDGSKVKPANGYWVKKGAEPIGAEPTPTSSEPKIGVTRIDKDSRKNWRAETNIDNFNGYDWRLSTVKTYSGKLVSSVQGGKTEKTGTKGYSMFIYVMYQDPNHTLEVSSPKRLTDKVVSEQHEKALAKFKKFMETGTFGRGGKISNFDKLSAKVAKEYEGKPVKSEYQEEYGKYYSKEEAQEVGDKVAGKVKAMQSDKKAFGGLFGGAKKLVTPSKKYPDLKGKEVMLKSGKYVQVFTQFDNKLTVLELGKFGTGERPHPIDIEEVDPTSYKMGGVTEKKKGSQREFLIKANNLAKQIRKDGESWQDAKKRAFAQLKK